MPRARGRAKNRQKEQRARRPGEAPDQSPAAPQTPPPLGPNLPPQQEQPNRRPDQIQAHQDVVEGIAGLALGAEGGQSQEAHGGTRPKTRKQTPKPQDEDLPRGRGRPTGGPGGQEAEGAEGGVVPRVEDVAYMREVREEGGQEMKRDDERGDRRQRNDETLQTRPPHIVKKMGVSGRETELITNSFSLHFPDNLVLYQYHVDYNPPCESKRLRMALLYVHENLIGHVHAFDGAMLFIPRRLHNQVTEVYSNRQTDNAQIRLTIKLTNELPPNHPQAIQVFNIIFRKQLKVMDMTQVQRHYFDFHSRINIPQHKLQVIPGVSASILPKEAQILLNVDLAHKLIRMDTVLDVMYETYQKRNSQDDIIRRVVGSIVLTRYNNKTYRVDDIDFDMFPSSKFRLNNGNEISYQDYFMQHYNERVTDPEQPLLMSRPTARDRARGDNQPRYLVPEFCIITGLSDEMKADFQVMRDVATHTRIAPQARVERLMGFRNRMDEKKEVREERENWGLTFSRDLVKLKGRTLDCESIVMANNTKLNYRPDSAEWSGEMRNKHILVPVGLRNWVVIYPHRMSSQTQDLIQTLSRVGPSMGMNLSPPTVVEIMNDRNESYVRALSESVKQDTQMVVCLVPNQKKDRYDAIKKFTVCERPVPSQVVVQRTLSKKQMLMSIATKIAIQLNCKLGGEVWAVEIPFRTPFMVVGIDTYHDSSVKNRSVGGVVCSLNKTCTRYYSRVTFQASHVELINGLTTVFTAALKKFYELHKRLPESIYVYRDGVGDGQLAAVVDVELQQILSTLSHTDFPDYRPKVAFIVVKKRINTRFFQAPRQGVGARNPPPGTLVDTVVTNQNWYDFFLVSQSVRQGTVTPTHYNVIHDTTGIPPDHMQRLAYKMTHLYYNWPGTIRVPAPCQYAHKLAFLVGQSIHREPSLHLSDKLFYL